jgi:lactoylglutathione lyase
MTVPDLADTPPHAEFVGWAHIALNVGSKADVDRMAEQARATHTLLSAPRMTGDGYYEAVIADPDGNRIELVGSNPYPNPLPKGERGSPRLWQASAS